MKRNITLLLVIVVLAGVGYWAIHDNKKTGGETPKQQPLAVSQHSPAFNQSMNQLLDSYGALAEAFVNWDTAAVSKNAALVKQNLDKLDVSDLKKDSAIYLTATSSLEGYKGDLDAMQKEADITKKRQAFNSFSQNFYDLLRVVHYDNSTVYLQQCPMAFNETEPGLWVSRTAAIRNPYLGLHHPKYGKGMIECGETKDSLNFTKAAAK